MNIATALAGGLLASGISSYSSENALLGAQTPVAGILQSLFLVGLFFVCAPLLPFIPLPVISALILSWVLAMTHWRKLSQVIKLGGADIAAWLAISFLTIVDLAIGVVVGLVIESDTSLCPIRGVFATLSARSCSSHYRLGSGSFNLRESTRCETIAAEKE